MARAFSQDPHPVAQRIDRLFTLTHHKAALLHRVQQAEHDGFCQAQALGQGRHPLVRLLGKCLKYQQGAVYGGNSIVVLVAHDVRPFRMFVTLALSSICGVL